MDPRIVRRLEDAIEESISRIFRQMGLGELPLLPSPRTTHLMAKAAVAVYESALDNSRHHDES